MKGIKEGIVKNPIDLIGSTPLLDASRYAESAGAGNANILVKLECFNPAGSIKDRVAIELIEDAERRGLIEPGGTLIEATSGNTGIGIGAVAALKGYKVIITLPDTMSIERRKLLEAFGTELILTDGAEGMTGAIRKAEDLNEELENSFVLRQFENRANVEAHRKSTGPEIWNQTEGKADILVAGVGTGGTITGTGQYLKEKNPEIRVVAVEPAGSPVLSGGKAGPHDIQGIGADFIPEILDTYVYDEVIQIKDEEAYEEGRRFVKTEGILVGISSGAALKAATILACREENFGKNIVVILPDSGDRYLSTPLFEEEKEK
ncbi:MAG TPA: cysteine synthase A [Mogibacterium sp.]|nr:cysteine synthase A [Mogibacterium sp.]